MRPGSPAHRRRTVVSHAVRALLIVGLWLVGGCDTSDDAARERGEADEVVADGDAAENEHDDAATDGHADASAGPASTDHGHGHAGEGGQPLIVIMRQMATDMAAMQQALWLEDYEQVAARAEAVALHEHMAPDEVARIETELGAEMAEFVRIDEAVHEAALEMHEAAAARQIDTFMERLDVVQRGCVACHERFRDRLRTAGSTTG